MSSTRAINAILGNKKLSFDDPMSIRHFHTTRENPFPYSDLQRGDSLTQQMIGTRKTARHVFCYRDGPGIDRFQVMNANSAAVAQISSSKLSSSEGISFSYLNYHTKPVTTVQCNIEYVCSGAVQYSDADVFWSLREPLDSCDVGYVFSS